VQLCLKCLAHNATGLFHIYIERERALDTGNQYMCVIQICLDKTQYERLSFVLHLDQGIVQDIEFFSSSRLIPLPLPIPWIQWLGKGDTDLLRVGVGVGVPSKLPPVLGPVSYSSTLPARVPVLGLNWGLNLSHRYPHLLGPSYEVG